MVSQMAFVWASHEKATRTTNDLVLYLDPDGRAREFELALVLCDALGQLLRNEWTCASSSNQTPSASFPSSGNQTM